MRLIPLTALLAVALLLGTLPVAADPTATPSPGDDAVVIAVVDSGFSPYNLNFRANFMPQHLDNDPSNDLPLHLDPAEWLPGYELTDDVVSTGAINLTLTEDRSAQIEDLEDADQAPQQLPESDEGAVHLRHIPGTKIIGAVDFGGGSDGFFGSNNTHGNGSASVSTGTIHGSCPECLVVLVRYSGEPEAASNWAMNQPWIDVVTNSWGLSAVMRDRIYNGSDTDLQREASERGQTIFFSAGNGQANTFTAPNTTYQSSQEGPDWIITVGAIAPNGANYTGTGKPADMASIGTNYPAGYGGTGVEGNGTFGGTSNATPVSAGAYGRSLWELRHDMAGPSRTQANGVVAVGERPCGAENASCATADDQVTATEMRFEFLQSLTRTPQGLTPAGIVSSNPPSAPAYDETEFMAEGHGSLFGRLGDLNAEVANVVDGVTGDRAPIVRSQAEHDWMVVDSYCRQEIHGHWDGGYYVEGQTELPSVTGPVTTVLQASCPTVFSALNAIGTDAPNSQENLDPQ